MPIPASGVLTFTTMRTEAGLSGAVNISTFISRFFGLPSGRTAKMSDFYQVVNPIKKIHQDATVLTGTSGSQISSWPGSDGQPTATGLSDANSTKPTLQIVSGRKHVNFNGSALQYFLLPSLSFTMLSAASTPINGVTVFLVARRSTTRGYWERFFDLGNGAETGNFLLARLGTDANTTIFSILDGKYAKLDEKVTITDGAWFVYSFVFQNATSKNFRAYLNGSIVASQNFRGSYSTITNRNFATNYIGKSHWFFDDPYLNGDIRELIVINSALVDKQMVVWSNYLKEKWAI